MRDTAIEMLSRGTKLRDEVDQFAAESMGVGLAQARFTLALLRELPATDQTLVQQYMTMTTSGSLQSHQVLLRLCDVYEITDTPLRDDILGLREAFRDRNLIVHEMDINFDSRNRRRTSRRRDRMVAHTEAVLRVTAEIIRRVQRKIDGVE